VNFVDLRDAGDAVALGARYVEEGADELVFLDITATVEKRKALASLVERVAAVLTIPFTVGGGIGSVSDVRLLLDCGADKISINSAAVRDPSLIDVLAAEFGSQCIVLAVDAKREGSGWRVYIDGGRTPSDRSALEWVREAVERGIGEILLTSMDHDGTKNGFAIELTRTVSEAVPVPVIASGGGGTIEHFKDVFVGGAADAALAASIFHFSELSIGEIKKEPFLKGIPVRL
jgi:cyclase